MIHQKAEFIRRLGLGGGMIWALDLDDFKDHCGEGVHPLLTELQSVLAEQSNEEDQRPESVVIEQTTEGLNQDSDVEIIEENEHDTSAIEFTSGELNSPSQDSDYKVVCYFTNWAWYRQGGGKYLPEDIDAKLCTHIVYGFAVLDRDSLTIKPHDTWADFDNRFYERVVAYKKKGVKVTVAIGGWNDSAGDKYSRLVRDATARARFIRRVIEFIEKYNFDGLDLDWEVRKLKLFNQAK